MTYLVWDERLSVGVPSVDARHKVLIEALNEFNTAVMRGAERDLVGSLLRGLVAYIRNHWASEERAMARLNYPDLEKHKGLHRQLLQMVQGQLDRFEHGEALNLNSLRLLRDGLINHIQQVDACYRPWIEAMARETAEAAAKTQTSNESCVDAKTGAALVSEARS